MGLNCGIVGLPNVGKSTIFSALTSAPAEVANYPFCTIDPNVGIVNVPDKRLKKISEIIPPQTLIPAVFEFVDIAGLVKGASKGEGLGNKFLANIRETDAILHVVRCFENEDITHVDGNIDPLRDIETINIELALADLETVEKRKERAAKEMRASGTEKAKEAAAIMPLLDKLQVQLAEGQPARGLEWSEDQLDLMKQIHLITLKETMYVCNVDENGINGDNSFVKMVKEVAAEENSNVVVICGQLEADIAGLETSEEKEMFLEEAGIKESGLSRLIHQSYTMLGLRTYFTAGEKEVRAWTFHNGNKAPQAAGVIHTDFEKGFIKAAVYHCEDLFELGSESSVKQAGKLRIEGKEYVVKDGDVMHFRFNV